MPDAEREASRRVQAVSVRRWHGATGSADGSTSWIRPGDATDPALGLSMVPISRFLESAPAMSGNAFDIRSQLVNKFGAISLQIMFCPKNESQSRPDRRVSCGIRAGIVYISHVSSGPGEVTATAA
jgi:hypothetical protein